MGYYRRRNYSNPPMADHFYNYRGIQARFNSIGSCGHEIKVSDSIGYHPGLKKAVCTSCWLKWCEENREAAQWEADYSYCMD